MVPTIPGKNHRGDDQYIQCKQKAHYRGGEMSTVKRKKMINTKATAASEVAIGHTHGNKHPPPRPEYTRLANCTVHTLTRTNKRRPYYYYYMPPLVYTLPTKIPVLKIPAPLFHPPMFNVCKRIRACHSLVHHCLNITGRQ